MRRSMIVLAGLVVVAGAASWSWRALFAQETPKVDPDALLPSNTLVYFAIHGGPEVQAAWEKSAAHKAIVESGLSQTLWSLLTAAAPLLGESAAMPTEMQELAPLAEKVLAHAMTHGVVVGADVRLLAGEVAIVLPEATKDGLAEKLDETARALCTKNGLEVNDAEIEGRKVASVKVDTFYLVWWMEGNHLVVSGNQLGANPAVRRAAGKGDNLTKTDRYKRFHAKKPFAVSGELWVDAPPLVKLVPQAIVPKLPEMLSALGLNNLVGMRISWGFENEAMRTDYDVFAPAPRHGALALHDGIELRLDRLPRLPIDTDMVQATSFDPVKAYDTALEILNSLAAIDPGLDVEQIKSQLAAYEEIIGISVRDELLAHLGPEIVLYSSSSDGPMGFLGYSAAIAVKDREKLEETLDRLANSLGLLDPKLTVEKKKVGDVTYWFGGYKTEYFPLAPTVALSDKWAVITPLTPAPALRFMQLQSSQGNAWTASAHPAPGHTGTTCGYMYSNPKPTIQLGASLLPIAVSTVRNTVPGFQFDMTKLPAMDPILESVFPGTATVSVSEDGLHLTSRYSLPFTGPELGLAAGGNPATVGVAAALILPAVQAAREAARNAQSMNNEKQIGISLHNYASAQATLPRGTAKEAAALPVEKRLSWIASVVPYLEVADVKGDLQFDKAWNADENSPVTDKSLPMFLNPALGDVGTNRTHYVGMAGVGAKAAELDAKDPKAGIFGYNRSTRFQNVLDGVSNTIMVIGVEKNIGPWGQGGPSTIRGLSEKPYIGGPDGFGGSAKGVTVLMADGSVRVLDKNIDPDVLEALSTMAGREVLEAP